MGLRYLSLFSGIEAATLAWAPLGWEAVAFAEIEPFPSAVLAHRFPNIPNLGDITKITEERVKQLGHVDLIVGGFPCQDLSVAGNRRGLVDAKTDTPTRSGLFFTAMDIVRFARKHCDLRFLLIENVPGLFSSKQGADFAAVLGEMVGCGIPIPEKGWQNTGVAIGPDGFAEWSCMDAQFFGVPQRRRRVFALADFGDWSNRPPILFESEGLRRDSAPSRETGKEVAGDAAPCVRAGGNNTGGDRPYGTDVDTCDSLQVVAFGGNNCSGPIDVATARTSHAGPHGRLDFESETFCVTHSLRGEGFDASEDGTGRGTPLVPVAFPANLSGTQCASTEDLSPSMGSKNSVAVAFDTTQITSATNRCNPKPGDPCHPLAAGVHPPAITFEPRFARNDRGGPAGIVNALKAEAGKTGRGDAAPCCVIAMQVRRLTPVECEFLQGMPRNHTLIPWRGKPAELCPDGPRYKAIGNSFAVPVVRWIGRRINMVLARMKELKCA